MCNKWYDCAERFIEPRISLNDAIEKFHTIEEQEIITQNLNAYERNEENEHFYKIIDKNLWYVEWEFSWTIEGVKDVLEYVINWNELTKRQIVIHKERALKRLFYRFDWIYYGHN